MLACHDAIKASGVKYTHAARLRADAVVLGPIPLPLHEVGPNDVVVPDNEAYGGINDRFAYGSFSGMMAYLSVLQSVPKYLSAGGKLNNAESAALNHLRDNGATVQQKPVPLCRFRNYTAGHLVSDAWDRTQQQCQGLYAQVKAVA